MLKLLQDIVITILLLIALYGLIITNIQFIRMLKELKAEGRL